MQRSRWVSYILHPVSFPLLWTGFYLWRYPGYISTKQFYSILVIVATGTLFLPVLWLLMLYRIGFIRSLHLRTAKERKYPLLINIFLALATGKLLLQAGNVSGLAFFFIAGGFALLVAYLSLYFHKKISLHSLGISSLTAATIYWSYTTQTNYLILIAFLFLLMGIVAAARIQLKAHNVQEVLLGNLIGFATQIVVPIVYQNI